MLDSIVGNSELKASLSAALSSERLAHSILLCGEEGVGTGYAATCLAADYLYRDSPSAAQQVMAGTSPELLIIEGEGASGDIKIDAIRALREQIYSTSLSSEGRCVLLRRAQHLNASSANALLKVLEEPPDNVLFILTAFSAAAVLPTIRSRCCIYSLAPTSIDECCEYLRANYKDITDARRLAGIFGGKIGRCVAVAKDARERASLDNAMLFCKYCEAKNEYAALALLVAYEKDKPAAQKLIQNARDIMSAAMRGQDGLYISRANAALALPMLYSAERLLRSNVSAKLIYTQLGMQIAAG